MGNARGAAQECRRIRMLVFAETAPTLSLSTASLDSVGLGRQSGTMGDKTAAKGAAAGSILGPGDEGDHLSPVVERLDCHSLGSIGPAWLGRQGRGGRNTFAGYRRTRDRGLVVPVFIDPLELSEVAMDGLQIVEDRMLAIVHAGSRVHVIEADRMAELMAERVAPR